MQCESFKYFNELIENYCIQNNIDLKYYIEFKQNKQQAEKQRRRKRKQRENQHLRSLEDHHTFFSNTAQQHQQPSENISNNDIEIPMNHQAGFFNSEQQDYVSNQEGFCYDSASFQHQKDFFNVKKENVEKPSKGLIENIPSSWRKGYFKANSQSDTNSQLCQQTMNLNDMTQTEAGIVPFKANKMLSNQLNASSSPCQQAMNQSDMTQNKGFFKTNSQSNANSQLCQQTINQSDMTQNGSVESSKTFWGLTPLQTMGFYHLRELAGIVPNDIIGGFEAQQQNYLENLKKDEVKVRVAFQ